MRALVTKGEAIREDQALATGALAELPRAAWGKQAAQHDETLELNVSFRAAGSKRLMHLAEPLGEIERIGCGGARQPLSQWDIEQGKDHGERRALHSGGGRAQEDVQRITCRAPKSQLGADHQLLPHGSQAAAGKPRQATHEPGPHPVQDEPSRDLVAMILAKDRILEHLRAHGRRLPVVCEYLNKQTRN